MEYKRVLVICIDRDADVTTKIGEEGPIYGKESVLSVATRLGLADPIETDTNALFEAIRIYDKYKNEGVSSEVVAVLGDPELGLKSDTKLSHQIDEAIKKYRPDGAVLVSDGAEDDHILPIVESRIKIISVRRVIVKQNEKLESTYYLLQDFLKDIVKDPKLARLFIGAPGVAAVLYMLLGENGWRLIVGIVGVFLLIKGFSLENLFEKGTKELRASFATGRISFFTYGVSLLIAILGIVVGYDKLSNLGVPISNLPNSAPIIINGSSNLIALAAIIALIGKSIDAILEKESLLKYILLAVFVIAFRIIIEGIYLFLIGDITYLYLTLMIIVGLVVSFISLVIIRSTWKNKTGKNLNSD
jgi:putative membrane protein|tara:strand:- start:588 stop:1664 length:1077 start_codon:yes stop_codon:yes gene_type:complete